MSWVLTCRVSQTKLVHDKPVTIGREGCDVLIKVGTEPKHAAIFFNPADQNYYVRDLAGSSGDGVFINGEKMDEVTVIVKLNDRLRFGYSHTTFTVEPSPSALDATQLHLDNLRAPSLDQAVHHVEGPRIGASPSPVPAASSPLPQLSGQSPGVHHAGNRADIRETSNLAAVSPVASNTLVASYGSSGSGASLTEPPYAYASEQGAAHIDHRCTTRVDHSTATAPSLPFSPGESSDHFSNGHASAAASSLPSNGDQRAGAGANGGSALYGVPNWWGQGADSVAEIHSVRPNASSACDEPSSWRPPTSATSSTPSSSSSSSSWSKSTAAPSSVDRSPASSSLHPPSRSSSTRRAATPDAPQRRDDGPLRRTSSLRAPKQAKPDAKKPQDKAPPASGQAQITPGSGQPQKTPGRTGARPQASPAPVKQRENTTVALRRAASAKRNAAREAEAVQEKHSSPWSARRARAGSVHGTASSASTATPAPTGTYQSSVGSTRGDGSSSSSNASKPGDRAVGKPTGRSASVKLPAGKSPAAARASPSTRVRSQPEARSPRQPLRATVPLSSSSASPVSSAGSSPATKRGSVELQTPSPATKTRARSPWRSIRDQARKKLNAEGELPSSSTDVIFVSGPDSLASDAVADGDTVGHPVESSSPQHADSQPTSDASAETPSPVESLASCASSSSLSDDQRQAVLASMGVSSVSSRVTVVTSADLSALPGCEQHDHGAQSVSSSPRPATVELPGSSGKPVFMTEPAAVDPFDPVCSLCGERILGNCVCGDGDEDGIEAAPAAANGSGRKQWSSPAQLDRHTSCPLEEKSNCAAPDLDPDSATALVAVATPRRQWNKMMKMDGLIVSSLLVLSDRLNDATMDMCSQGRGVHEWQRQHGTVDSGGDSDHLLDCMSADSAANSDPTLYPPWGAEHQDMATIMRNIRLAESRVKAICDLLKTLPKASSP